VAGCQPFGGDMSEYAAAVALLDQNGYTLGRHRHNVTWDAIPGLPSFSDARNPENRLPGCKVCGSHCASWPMAGG